MMGWSEKLRKPLKGCLCLHFLSVCLSVCLYVCYRGTGHSFRPSNLIFWKFVRTMAKKPFFLFFRFSTFSFLTFLGPFSLFSRVFSSFLCIGHKSPHSMAYVNYDCWFKSNYHDIIVPHNDLPYLTFGATSETPPTPPTYSYLGKNNKRWRNFEAMMVLYRPPSLLWCLGWRLLLSTHQCVLVFFSKSETDGEVLVCVCVCPKDDNGSCRNGWCWCCQVDCWDKFCSLILCWTPQILHCLLARLFGGGITWFRYHKFQSLRVDGWRRGVFALLTS